jgi:hypothetical protein
MNLGRFGIMAWLCCGALTCSASAQVIQIPTFRSFTVDTTVWVPDSGGSYLGGTSSAMSGFDTRGVPLLGKAPLVDRLFKNRAIGSSLNSAGASAHVAVHSMSDLDRAILEEAAARRAFGPPQGQLITRRDAGQRRGVDGYSGDHRSGSGGRSSNDQFVDGLSIAEIRRQQEREAESSNAEAQRLIEQGRAAAESGKPGVARILYQQAAKKGTGTVQEQARQQIAELARESIKRVVAKAKP